MHNCWITYFDINPKKKLYLLLKFYTYMNFLKQIVLILHKCSMTQISYIRSQSDIKPESYESTNFEKIQFNNGIAMADFFTGYIAALHNFRSDTWYCRYG